MKCNNWRLERIASSICSCLLTDGFCSPRDKPDCGCWIAARAAVNGLENQANSVLKEAWPDVAQGDGEIKDNATRRARLNALCKAILSREDELTEEHRRFQPSRDVFWRRCPVCGSAFYVRHAGRKYCSSECRTTAWKIRQGYEVKG